jgi:hypothetical protein
MTMQRTSMLRRSGASSGVDGSLKALCRQNVGFVT